MSITAALLVCLSPAVYDGDTFRCSNSPTSVRLFGIQAPERGEPNSIASTANLANLLTGGVICEPRGTNYSRIVAICWNAGGVELGRAQLNAGHAVEWCTYSRNYYGRCP